ncbi:MAG: glycosyltransferase [Chitinophagales bacterium]
MKVLYLSYDGMTDPLGQSQVIPYLRGLTKLGYNFYLISFEKPERFEKLKSHIQKIMDEAGINWHPLAYTKNPPVVSTMLDLQKMEKLAFQLHGKHNFRIVHCRSYISALVGIQLKEKAGVKFLFDMRGFWADERVEGGIWNLSNPLYKGVYRYFKNKEREFFTKADYTISLTEAGKKEIQSWKNIGGQPIPMQVIPCCADLDLFDAERVAVTEKQRLRTELGIREDDFVLSYVGSIGTWYMPDEMFDFFKVLNTEVPNARFLFVTPESPETVIARAKSRGVNADKIVVTHATHKQVPAYISLSNWSLFFIKPVFSKLASSPTKQGEIMGMGIPHVCNTGVGDVAEILQNGESGIALSTFNGVSYKKAVDEMLKGSFSKEKIRQNAFRVYSLQEGVKKYAEVYSKLA